MVVSITGLAVKLHAVKKYKGVVFLTDFGTDIHTDWGLTSDGDLQIISNTGNLDQAITNRLTCGLDNLDLFYDGYGCNLSQFLGWRKTEQTLQFIKLELENRLRNEPRLESFNVKVDYSDNSNGIVVSIDLNPSEDYIHTVELRINEDGVETI